MEDYVKVLNKLFESYESELAAALDGNIEKYCYKEEVTEEEGVHDANYTNRLRLAYTILYTKENKTNNRIYGLILRLYSEELIDRETNDFQGVGSCLNVLSVLLNKYEIPARKELFERARRANFDCSLGFSNPESYINSTLESYDSNSAIQLLIELEENKLASNLLSKMINSDKVIDKSQMCFYKVCFHNLGDIDNEIATARKIMNMSVLSDNNFETCSIMINLIKLINEKGAYEEAAKIFDMLIPRLHAIDNWYGIGLGRQSFDQCMDIILNCDPYSEDLWEWAEPFLKKIVDNMHGNLYKKASLAAYKMGDFEFSVLLSEKYNELVKCLHRTKSDIQDIPHYEYNKDV